MGSCTYHDPKLDEDCTCLDFVANPDNPRQCWDCRHYVSAHGGKAASISVSSKTTTSRLPAPAEPKNALVLDFVRRGQTAAGKNLVENARPSSSAALQDRRAQSLQETFNGFRKQEADVIALSATSKQKKKKHRGGTSAPEKPAEQKIEAVPIHLLVMLDCGASHLTTAIAKPDSAAVQSDYVMRDLAVRGPDKKLTFSTSMDDFEQVSSWLCKHIPSAATYIARAAEQYPEDCPLVLLVRRKRELAVWQCKDGTPTAKDLILAKGNSTQSYKNHELWFTYRRMPTTEEIEAARQAGNLKGKKRARSLSSDDDDTESESDIEEVAPKGRVAYDLRSKRSKSGSSDHDATEVTVVTEDSPAAPLFLASTASSPGAQAQASFKDYSLGLDGFELAELEEIQNDPQADMSDEEPEPSTSTLAVLAVSTTAAPPFALRTTTPPAVAPTIAVSPPKMKVGWAERFLKHSSSSAL